MSKLNFNRPFGSIVGTYSENPSARYTQDGKFFDASGNDCTHKALNKPSSEELKQVDAVKQPEPVTEQVADTVKEPVQEPVTDTVKEPEQDDGKLVMDKTDDELAALAAAGMSALRDYADNFGVKGTSKKEIIGELKALR